MRAIIFAAISTILIPTLETAILTCNNSPIKSCSYPEITEITSPSEIITVNGKPTGYTIDNTKQVFIESPQQMPYVPTGIFKIFINLEEIRLLNVNLISLVSNAFKDCDKLTTIIIIDNKLPIVPASIASTCINLTKITLTRNKINSIHVDAFKGLIFLSMLDLSSNAITCIHPDTFQHIPNVTTITLSDNLIMQLDPMTFRGLPKLSNLYIDNNYISSFPVFNLTETSSEGLFVYVENNPIVAVHPKMLLNIVLSRKSKYNYVGYTRINYFDSENYVGFNTCIRDIKLSGPGFFDNHDWRGASELLSDCYSNWGSQYERPVSCASTRTQKCECNDFTSPIFAENVVQMVSNSLDDSSELQNSTCIALVCNKNML